MAYLSRSVGVFRPVGVVRNILASAAPPNRRPRVPRGSRRVQKGPQARVGERVGFVEVEDVEAVGLPRARVRD